MTEELIKVRCSICQCWFLPGDMSEIDDVCSDCYYENEMDE